MCLRVDWSVGAHIHHRQCKSLPLEWHFLVLGSNIPQFWSIYFHSWSKVNILLGNCIPWSCFGINGVVWTDTLEEEIKGLLHNPPQKKNVFDIQAGVKPTEGTLLFLQKSKCSLCLELPLVNLLETAKKTTVHPADLLRTDKEPDADQGECREHCLYWSRGQ